MQTSNYADDTVVRVMPNVQRADEELRRECEVCKQHIAPHWQTCAHCEVRLATACERCGVPLPPAGSLRCGHCGLPRNGGRR